MYPNSTIKSMNRPFAIGLIIFFILLIAASAFWLAIRPKAPEIAAPEQTTVRRFFGFFGLPAGQPPTTINGTSSASPAETTAPQEPLVLLSTEPIVGYAVASSGVRYIERGTGHVVDVSPRGDIRNRISNTTISKIFSVAWSSDASRALLSYIESESVRVVSATFSASSTNTSLMPSSVLSAVFSPFTPLNILYLLPSDTGARAVIANPDNSKPSETVTTPFPEFLVAWPDKNTLSFTTRPSGNVPGFLFTYDLAAHQLSKLLGDVMGLEVLWSKSGKRLLYSYYNSQNQLPRLFALELKTKTVLDLGVTTLASKCVFSSNDETVIYCGMEAQSRPALYPDDWLQGALSFTDKLWKINLTTLEKNLLATNQTFDASQLRTSNDDRFLYFVNKKNNSLWSYKIAD